MYAGILALVLLFGGANLLFAPTSDTVRVASIAEDFPGRDPNIPVSLQCLCSGEITEAELESLRAAFSAMNDDLLERCEREARVGARIIYWAEQNRLD